MAFKRKWKIIAHYHDGSEREVLEFSGTELYAEKQLEAFSNHQTIDVYKYALQDLGISTSKQEK